MTQPTAQPYLPWFRESPPWEGNAPQAPVYQPEPSPWDDMIDDYNSTTAETITSQQAEVSEAFIVPSPVVQGNCNLQSTFKCKAHQSVNPTIPEDFDIRVVPPGPEPRSEYQHFFQQAQSFSRVQAHGTLFSLQGSSGRSMSTWRGEAGSHLYATSSSMASERQGCFFEAERASDYKETTFNSRVPIPPLPLQTTTFVPHIPSVVPSLSQVPSWVPSDASFYSASSAMTHQL